jgi:hypothetical protein
MQNWTAIEIVKQVAGELGLPQPQTLFGQDNPQIDQLVALLNSSGNELLTYYPWEQFVEFWNFQTVDGQQEYPVPDDWAYFVDQTQWDQTNHWPLLGPKSPQEWAWLKGGLLQAAPRMRYRVYNNKFVVWPIPAASTVGNPFTPFTLDMEYIRSTWVTAADLTQASMVTNDSDLVEYHPWMVIKFVKLKFYELKGFDTSGVRGDFMRIFQSLTGKDRGAPKLSLAPRFPPLFIGPWSIPDGSWDVNPGMTP